MSWLVREPLVLILLCSYIHDPTVLLLLFSLSNSKFSSATQLLLFRTASPKSRAFDCLGFPHLVRKTTLRLSGADPTPMVSYVCAEVFERVMGRNFAWPTRRLPRLEQVLPRES